MTQKTSVTPEAPHWILMAKALKGELTEREKQDFTAWLEEDKIHAEQWAAAMHAWQTVDTQETSSFTPNVGRAWQKTKARLDFSAKPLPFIDEEVDANSSGFNWSTFLRYAAVVVLAIGFGWLVYSQWNVSSSEWTEVATRTGEKKAVYLPDSSMVTLNGNSTLRYQTAFDKEEREVELTGEGFFQVKKNPAQPFIVHTSNAETRVLGTSFHIRALPKEKEISVAVITGKVAFSSMPEKKKVILTPGFTGTLRSDGSLDKKETGIKPSWNTLAFQGATLQEVATALEAHFGIKVQIMSPALANCVFTGTFENPDLQNILQVLVASNDVQLHKSSSGVYQLTGKGCLK